MSDATTRKLVDLEEELADLVERHQRICARAIEVVARVDSERGLEASVDDDFAALRAYIREIEQRRDRLREIKKEIRTLAL